MPLGTTAEGDEGMQWSGMYDEEVVVGWCVCETLSRVKMCFTPSALFQALGPVVTSKLLGVCDIQQ